MSWGVLCVLRRWKSSLAIRCKNSYEKKEEKQEKEEEEKKQEEEEKKKRRRNDSSVNHSLTIISSNISTDEKRNVPMRTLYIQVG
jgi:hypothetical protein